MDFNLIQLTHKSDILGIYNIYKHCMYMPNEEKYTKQIDTFLNNNSVKIFACLYGDKIKGIIVVSFIEQHKIEIMGIAVDVSARHQGIGSYMISKLTNDYGLLSVYAETDGDAVGFYRKCGFSITKFAKIYNGETFIRYKCELAK